MEIVREAERPVIDRAPAEEAAAQGRKRTRASLDDEEVMEIDEPDEGGGGDADVEEAEEGASYEAVIADKGEEGEPAAKRIRVTWKVVSWIFVDKVEEEGKFTGKVICRLGCVQSPNRYGFSAAGTSHVERHVAAKYPSIFQKFELSKSNRYSLAQLEEEINTSDNKTLVRLAKDKETADKFFRRTKSGSLDNKVKCDMEFLSWAVANGMLRLALNCPILDMALHAAGATPLSNRHDLATEHLMQLGFSELLEAKNPRDRFPITFPLIAHLTSTDEAPMYAPLFMGPSSLPGAVYGGSESDLMVPRGMRRRA